MLRDALRMAFAVLTVVLLGAWLGLALFSWASGCGEHWTDSNGTVHVERCTSIYSGR
jgi:uncharacterized membrane protein